MVILTDGGENASKEFKNDEIKNLIDARTKDGWQFVFIGANQDSFATAGQMGINPHNTMNYAGDAKTTRSAMKSMSSNVSDYACSMSNDASTLMFTGQQKAAAMGQDPQGLGNANPLDSKSTLGKVVPMSKRLS